MSAPLGPKGQVSRALDHMQQAALHLEQAMRQLEAAHATMNPADHAGRRTIADTTVGLSETRGRLVRFARKLGGGRGAPTGTDARGEVAEPRGHQPETRL